MTDIVNFLIRKIRIDGHIEQLVLHTGNQLYYMQKPPVISSCGLTPEPAADHVPLMLLHPLLERIRVQKCRKPLAIRRIDKLPVPAIKDPANAGFPCTMSHGLF